MTTAELITQLQACDPTGETECVVGNEPIYFVQGLPAFYDGRMQVLIRDKSSEYYNVTGAKITGKGQKISIMTHSVEDALCENPELPVETETPYDAERVEKWRQEARDINAKVFPR